MVLIALPFFVFVAESTGRAVRSGPSLVSGFVLSTLLLLFVFLLAPEAGNYAYSQFGRAAPGDLPPIPSPLRLLRGEPSLPLSFMFVGTRVLTWLELTILVCGTAVLAYRMRLWAATRRCPAFVTVGAIVTVAILTFVSVFVLSMLLRSEGIRFGLFTQALIPMSVGATAFVAAGWLARRTRVPGNSAGVSGAIGEVS